MTSGNFPHFSRPTDSPLHSPYGRQFACRKRCARRMWKSLPCLWLKAILVTGAQTPHCHGVDNNTPNWWDTDINYLQSNIQSASIFHCISPALLKQGCLVSKNALWIKFYANLFLRLQLTHWGHLMHLCASKLTIIGSDNAFSPEQCQAIIWTNAGILLIGPLWTNFSEIFIEILTFSLKKIHLKMLSVKWQPFCLGLCMLISQHWFI